MVCAEIIIVIKDVLVASAAAITATVAIVGLQSWKKQLTGKAEFDTSRELLKSTYKLRDGLERFRSPFISAGEFPNGYIGAAGNHSDNEHGQAYAKVYGDRWASDISAPIQEFDTFTIEAEALWDTDIKDKYQELRACVNNLRASLEAFIRDQYSGGRDFQANYDFGVSIGRDVSSTGSIDNPLTTKINNAINEIEKYLRPHLQRS